MKLLVVSEKPAVTRWIAEHVRATWPHADVTFVHSVPFGNIQFSYPRGLKLQDYPRVSEPAYKLRECETWSCSPMHMADDGTLAPCSMRMGLFSEADLIVFANDPDHSGVGAFEVILRDVFGDDRAMSCPALMLNAYDKAGLDRAFANMLPFGDMFTQTIQYGRIKRYFDFNWNMNALAILGETARRVGVPADAPPLSKYALQLLYDLRHTESVTENDMHNKMCRWEGTGRYQYPKGDWRPTLGSMTSRQQIIDNLTEAGLLVRAAGRGVHWQTVSARGHALMGLLHRNCEDRDLPFRIHFWCEEGEGARPAIDRYIKTLFGKQLRFLGK